MCVEGGAQSLAGAVGRGGVQAIEKEKGARLRPDGVDVPESPRARRVAVTHSFRSACCQTRRTRRASGRKARSNVGESSDGVPIRLVDNGRPCNGHGDTNWIRSVAKDR